VRLIYATFGVMVTAAAIAIPGLTSGVTSNSPEFTRLTLPTGRGPGSVAIVDVNHDGKPDILVADTASETLTVLLGDGSGHFRPAPGAACPTGRAPNDIAVGDFNNDGNIDLVIANTETPNLTILLGDGKGGFKPAPHSPFATTSHPHVHGVAVADFNSDGKLDVVTDSWGNNQIIMLFGDGAGALELPGRRFDTGRRPYQRLRTADLNRDGKADVITTDLDQNAVSILLGDGKGGLHDAPGSPFVAGIYPWAVAVDDLNGDGNADLVILPYARDITDPKQLVATILLGDGKGGFAARRGSAPSLVGCEGPDRVATGDLNGDGLRDIAVTCAQNNKVMLFAGSRNGEFQRIELDVPTGWSGIGVADLNGDGKDDIVISNNGANASGELTVLLSRHR